MTTVKQLIRRFNKFEIITGILCILLPFILILTNGSTLHSISAYAYSPVSYIFVFLLTLAATLITIVGVRQNKKLIWAMGIALMIVPLTPAQEFPIIHMLSAGLFFVGVAVDILVDTQKLNKYRIFLVVAIALSFGTHFAFDWISLFWAESIALIIFGSNFLLDLIQEKKDL
jgi:hypothetical protein